MDVVTPNKQTINKHNDDYKVVLQSGNYLSHLIVWELNYLFMFAQSDSLHKRLKN